VLDQKVHEQIFAAAVRPGDAVNRDAVETGMVARIMYEFLLE